MQRSSALQAAEIEAGAQYVELASRARHRSVPAGSGLARHATHATILSMRCLRSLLAIIILSSTFVAAQRQLTLDPKLYDPSVDARKEIGSSLREAKTDHKRVILVFGGNWCFDCHVLNYWFHQPGIVEIVDDNYHVVHVDIGQFDKNIDLTEKYGVNIKKGVPAISILGSDGKLLYGDKNGEFEKARSMNPNDIVTFLQKWKPTKSSK
jgi:thioredoxin 1